MDTNTNDMMIFRECNQWRAVYSSPTLADGRSALFSNFGSIKEDTTTFRDHEELISQISKQFALDVYHELKPMLQFDPERINSSQTERKNAPPKLNLIHKTPTVTPHNSRRGPRSNHPVIHPLK